MKIPTSILMVAAIAGSLAITSCASSSMGAGGTGGRSPANMSTTPSSPDPRIGLRAGWHDADQAAWNMRLVAAARPSPRFTDSTANAAPYNSDLAFKDNYVIQGSYNGFQIWDVSNPGRPTVVTAFVCKGSQGDVSVYGNLLFNSVEETGARNDCGTQGVQAVVSPDRFRGVRIFDISDVRNPRLITNVQTCRGSHTHTVVDSPSDRANVYIYNAAMANVRSSAELAGCIDVAPEQDTSTQRFKIDVIQVPLANPAAARVISKPAVLANLDSVKRAAGLGTLGPAGGGRPGGVPFVLGPVSTACHDITVYPAIGLAGGACIGYGLLLDIGDPADPKRLRTIADTNVFGYHSVTFSNDGSKFLISDEWGGGAQPKCRATDRKEWGANTIYTRSGTQLTRRSYYKLPVAQTASENCVAHNGNLIPIPGRDVMVQGWYQGGVSVFDWTDPANPFEIAFFDRGPLNADTLLLGGSWSAYWHNGYIYSSEIKRGLDILELQPSGLLTQNEIDAAKSVRYEDNNPQYQVPFVWPASFSLARAYLDQLARSNGLSAARRMAVANELGAAEKLSVSARHAPLMNLAGQLDGEARTSSDGAKVRLLADVVRKLSGM